VGRNSREDPERGETINAETRKAARPKEKAGPRLVSLFGSVKA